MSRRSEYTGNRIRRCPRCVLAHVHTPPPANLQHPPPPNPHLAASSSDLAPNPPSAPPSLTLPQTPIASPRTPVPSSPAQLQPLHPPNQTLPTPNQHNQESGPRPKCKHCTETIAKSQNNPTPQRCISCEDPYHISCAGLRYRAIEIRRNWSC